MTYTPRNAATKGPIPSGFCEVGSCGYCRKGDCPCSCHKAIGAAPGTIRDYADFDPANPAGVWRGIPEDVYHGDTTTLSASSAKVLLGKRSPDDSWALRFGSLCHVVLLEPHRLSQYVVLDAAAIAGNNPKTGKPYDAPTMTSKWKAAVREAEESGLTVVSQEDWDRAHAIVDAIHAHPTARHLLDVTPERELSAYAVHETGAMVRGRFDLFGPGLVVDLKTITNGSPAAFGKTCFEFGYHISAANYLDLAAANGLDAQGFAFINAEKEPTPGGKYRISVIQLTDRALELGREQMAEGCRRWLANNRVVDLPDYGPGFHTVDLPPWAYQVGATTYEEIPA